MTDEPPRLSQDIAQQAHQARQYLHAAIAQLSDADALALWEHIAGWFRPQENDDASA